MSHPPTFPTWSPTDLPDLAGLTALVTGGNSGIGLATSKALAARGARVIVSARDQRRGERALSAVLAQGGGAQAELLRLDLADLAGVRAAAAELGHRVAQLDLLVNNAGIMATPARRTVDGFESQMATNHLGHFALTGLLMPLLRAAPTPRVVTVSSLVHRIGRLGVDDPLGERARYHAWAAYGRSKLANLLFAMELQRRVDAAEIPLLSLAAHPGVAATNLIASGPLRRIPGLSRAVGAALPLWSQSAAHGAWPVLYAATRRGLVGGEFVGPSGLGETRGPPTLVVASPMAYDAALAHALWERSAELTGVGYPSLH